MKKINFKIGDKVKITEDEERLYNARNRDSLPYSTNGIFVIEDILYDYENDCSKIKKCGVCNLLRVAGSRYCNLKFERVENWIKVKR